MHGRSLLVYQPRVSVYITPTVASRSRPETMEWLNALPPKGWPRVRASTPGWKCQASGSSPSPLVQHLSALHILALGYPNVRRARLLRCCYAYQQFKNLSALPSLLLYFLSILYTIPGVGYVIFHIKTCRRVIFFSSLENIYGDHSREHI